MTQSKNPISLIIEGALFASSEPMTLNALKKYLPEGTKLTMGELREILNELEEHYANRGINLVEVASGYRFQISPEATPHLATFYEDKPQKFSRAFMETLALIAYRQPITRGEIEEIRGIVVSSNIIKTLMELEWIRIVGHKDVPGKPALLATTSKFLDFFGLSKLEELPPLAELKELTSEMITDVDADALGLEGDENKLLLDDEEENAADEDEINQTSIEDEPLEQEIDVLDDDIEVSIADEVEETIVEADSEMADNDPESTTDRFPQVVMTGPEQPEDDEEDLDDYLDISENE